MNANLKHLAVAGWMLASATAVLLPTSTQAQVVYVNQVPTEQDIQAALGITPPSPAALPKGRRTKGIHWSSEPTETSAVTQVRHTTQAPAAPVTSRPDHALAFPVKFEAGLSRVPKSSMPYLKAIANVMQRNPDLKLMVEGHTDTSGDPHANVVLSWERSTAVFRVMVERFGIDPMRLQPVGKGMAEPLPSFDPSDSINRRVQFRVTG